MDSAQGRDTSPAGCKLECWQGHRLHVDLKESVRSEWAPASGLTHTLSESRSRVSDIAGVPASTHPLGYVGAPDLSGARALQPSQQVGVDLVAWMRLREPALGVERLNPHFPQEGANMAPANLVALVPEFVLDASAAHKRILQMNLVHETHEIPIPIAYRHRGVVDA